MRLLAARDRDLPSAAAAGLRGGTGALRALAVANARFWPTVAPEVRRELAQWRSAAQRIEHEELRSLATREAHRRAVQRRGRGDARDPRTASGAHPAVRAIVALEVLFDYLDGRTEMASEDPLAEGRRLFAPFTGALGLEAPVAPDGGEGADWSYLTALARRTWECSRTLPAIGCVAQTAQAAAERCAQAQTRIHASGALGERPTGGLGERRDGERGPRLAGVQRRMRLLGARHARPDRRRRRPRDQRT